MRGARRHRDHPRGAGRRARAYVRGLGDVRLPYEKPISADIIGSFPGFCRYVARDLPGPKGDPNAGGKVPADTRFRIEFEFEGRILDTCQHVLMWPRRRNLVIKGVCTMDTCQFTGVSAKQYTPILHWVAGKSGVKLWFAWDEDTVTGEAGDVIWNTGQDVPVR